MWWLLLLGGGVVVFEVTRSSGPSIPGNLSTIEIERAVTVALAKETNAGFLRAFAKQLAPFRVDLANELTARATALTSPIQAVEVKAQANAALPRGLSTFKLTK